MTESENSASLYRPVFKRTKAGTELCEQKSNEPGGIKIKDIACGMRYANHAYFEEDRESDSRLTTVVDFNRKSGACQGFIGHTEDDIILSFRGTDEPSDWFFNIRYWVCAFQPHRDKSKNRWCRCLARWMSRGVCNATICGQPKVHTGVYSAFLECIAEIDTELVRLLVDSPKQKRLIICGHSLGGALALAALAYLLTHPDLDFEEQIPVKVLFVAIAPFRFGDHTFEKMIKEKIKQLKTIDKCSAVTVMHELDPCPCLPPEWAGFRHATTTAFITIDNIEPKKRTDDNGKECICGNKYTVGKLMIGEEVEAEDIKRGRGCCCDCCHPAGKRGFTEIAQGFPHHGNMIYANIIDSLKEQYPNQLLDV